MRKLLPACLFLLALSGAWAQSNLDFKRTEDVIYGRKFGTALTLDVFQPRPTNGVGIVFMVSGGWFSSHESISGVFFKPLLKRGYTVFAVVHGSQPKFVVTEIVEDIHRSLRFIRHNAVQYGVDPDKLGIMGASAGGHLSLTMGTQGGPGDAKAKDPIDRESSAVQCVACLFPPTDFLNYGQPGEDAVGVGVLKSFKPAFGPRSDTEEGRQKLGREISPIYFVHSNMPPMLIIHGDADKLVPIYQAQMFVERCQSVGSTAKLAVREGKGHGWPDFSKDMEMCADWFDQYSTRPQTKAVIEPSLQEESDKLARSWTQHDASMLRDYLVAGVEDPRVNVQSVLSRHFLIHALTGERFGALMEQEIRFAAAMNCLAALVAQVRDAEELELIRFALKRGADNAEGIAIPEFLVRTFAALPTAGDANIPNYIEAFLSGSEVVSGQAKPHQPSLDTFRRLWNQALAPGASASQPSTLNPQLLTVLEPACGSANDYRYLHDYGLAPLVRYTGFDLCAKNIENARILFPDVSFAGGNVFEIAAPEKAFDLCFVHDLFEHLSLEGLQAAAKEVCRVTRQGICVGFFNMDEIRDHEVRPVDNYHWNRLSMRRMRELFVEHGFAAHVVHIGTFLRQHFGCDQTHNPNAYTFLLHPIQRAA